MQGPVVGAGRHSKTAPLRARMPEVGNTPHVCQQQSGQMNCGAQNPQDMGHGKMTHTPGAVQEARFSGAHDQSQSEEESQDSEQRESQGLAYVARPAASPCPALVPASGCLPSASKALLFGESIVWKPQMWPGSAGSIRAVFLLWSPSKSRWLNRMGLGSVSDAQQTQDGGAQREWRGRVRFVHMLRLGKARQAQSDSLRVRVQIRVFRVTVVRRLGIGCLG